MIDLKLFSVISVTLILYVIVINGQNIKYQRYREQPTVKSMAPRKYHLKANNNRNRQSAASNLDTAESDAHHSYHTGDNHNDLASAASHHGHHGGHGYFQYLRVPHPQAWEFGYRKGNPWHFREQHEQGHGHQFKTKLRWGDKHGGYGEHYWDFNHVDKTGGQNY